ncbi:MAG: hypothetical protein ACOVOA_18880, partial [Allorhizobium sp.]
GFAADAAVLLGALDGGAGALSPACGNNDDPDCSAQLLLHRPAWSMTHFLCNRALSAQNDLFQHLPEFLSMRDLCLLASHRWLAKNSANTFFA